MNEKELAKALQDMAAALLRQGSGGSVDTGPSTRKILQRDKRRVRLFAITAIVLWLVTVLLIGLLVFQLTWGAFPELHGQMLRDTDSPAAHGLQIQFMAVEKGLAVMAISVVALSLAALCTIVLVLLSRRATLRHVDAGLADIAEQLKQLRDTRVT
jgi:hypothetical protein